MALHQQRRDEIDIFTKIIHLGLAVFGLLAWLSGDMADDYKEMANIGFYFHAWIGIGAVFFTGLRFIYGMFGPQSVRFMNWAPYTKDRIALAREDFMGLLKFKLPERQSREGIAAVVEMTGLLIFFFLATTGVVLFLTIDPGHKVDGMAHFFKELHEAGEILLPLFFSVHVGAVILHALKGNHLWRKMVFLNKR